MTQPDVITNPCGCNQPHAVHERGDQAFCRAWHAADRAARAWRVARHGLPSQALWDALDELEQVWPA